MKVRRLASVFAVFCLVCTTFNFMGASRESVCQAQYSDASGSRWVVCGYVLQSDGSLQQLQQIFSRRGVTAIQYSLRSELLIATLLKLDSATGKNVDELLGEYDRAKRDPAHRFSFDPRVDDQEEFISASNGWQKVWRDKMTEVLGPERLEVLDRVTTYSMLGHVGLEGTVRLHADNGTQFLGISPSQQQKLQSSISAWRQLARERNQRAVEEHLANIIEVFSAEQKALFERDYEPYVRSLQSPIELVGWQLSLSESSDIVREKLIPNGELSDAWLSLPNYFKLNPNGELSLELKSGGRTVEQKLKLLDDLQSLEIMDISPSQAEKLLAIKAGNEKMVQELESEFSRKVNEAKKLQGLPLEFTPYSDPREVKIVKDLQTNAEKEKNRRQEQFSRDIDEVLVPRQIAYLEIVGVRAELRLFGLINCLRFGRLGSELGINAKQRELLQRIQERSQQQLKTEATKLEQEVLDQWTAYLTSEQRVEWKKLIGPKSEFFHPIPNLLLIRPFGS